MSADEHLSPQQFMHMDEFKKLYSGDYDEPMTKTMSNMQSNYKEYMSAKPGETYYGDEVHHEDLQHGGPRAYVNHLKADIAQNGITKPLEIRGGNVLTDGHHRGVAAMELGLPGVPVRHIK